ncbi:hypothetical protein J14TS2_30270 [Bacillus sp. J14TS2]|uniref:AraC family transcriptional regulator n=1 Tax=Bacillus sp. J14TS2 TaxID=2807188 RepID=UPI001AFED23E|nr:AraC family transcriptional regulator [Bacillus sp. J14TS2]GIN72552.1 hypothetical protein J14TS2_30270 [Bacillus sp. J14TS2]
MNASIRLPKLVNHVFWDKKEHFLLKQDTYLTWILFAIEEGDFTYRIHQSEGHAKKGDVVICPPQIAFHRKIQTPLSFHAISFNFPHHEIGSLQDMLQEKEQKLFIPPTTRLFENYQQLRKLHLLSDVYELKQHYFHDLWMSMIHKSLEERHPVLEQILAYLEEHAHHSIEIKNVATKFQLTSVQLIRSFKKVYHMTPVQYLTSIRLKKAANLLLETDWNLDTIAQECGYESGYYLSRIFNKHMEIRPSEYRKINRF